jgi:hypothetical protein
MTLLLLASLPLLLLSLPLLLPVLLLPLPLLLHAGVCDQGAHADDGTP